ncbi:MAG: cytochrome P450 704B1 [Hyperionvirus sp.]|uniref:Cytochrome P450 704B1 n=1 Tax=Hyperionvirus sp. TaxID=2487770 RepID=A0A3G5A9R1_9VIRU|nr:MAG: cytochrome P450 704B1 [Hyperionvirus sp.]
MSYSNRYMLAVFGACLCVVAVGFIFWERARYLKGVYYPGKTLALIGNSIEVGKNIERLHDWKLYHAKKAIGLGGKCWQYSLFGRNAGTLELLDPELIKYVLKTNMDNFGKGGLFNETFRDLLGDGIFNSDGASWKLHRALISPIFSARRLTEHMEGVFLKHGYQVINILERAARDDQTIDLQDLFFRYTFDCICEIAFGFESNTLERNNEFSGAFDKAQRIIFGRMFTLPIVWKSKRLLGVMEERELSEAIGCLDKYVWGIIEERREDKSFSERDDLLSWAMNNMGLQEINYLRDLVLNVMIAGRDTTACTLTWLFYILGRRGDIDGKIYEEIESVVGDDAVSYEHLKEMKYLGACVSETLRLYPAVPMDGKVSVEDCVLPNGLKIPRGTNIFYSAYVINRLESIWGKDAESFVPERWFDGPNVNNISGYVFPTFNAGARLCLGKPMALVEIKILAVMLLKKFRFTFTREATYNLNIVLSMKGGLNVMVRERGKKLK